MSHRIRWVSVALVVLIVLSAVGYAFARSNSAPATHRDIARQPAGSLKALALWRRFAAGARPRPLILTGQGRIEAPVGGFPSRADEAAFLTGRYRLQAHLPAAPAASDGYRVLSAAAAYRTIRHRIPGHRARPHGRLIIRAVRFGYARFKTDRGERRLPAWKFSFIGVLRPVRLLAVVPSSIFTAPDPRRLTDDDSPSPDRSATILRDDKTITVSFIGAAAGSKPCEASYSLAATADRDAVALAVVEHPAPAPPQTVCLLGGYERSATIHLARQLGPRALIAGENAAVISVVKQNPKRLTASVPGEGVERAQLGSYCLPSSHGSEGCGDAAFDPSPPGRLPVAPGNVVTFGLGALAKSVSVRLARTNPRGQVSYPVGTLHGGRIGPGNRWEVQLPKQLPPVHVLEVFVRYPFGDADFEAGINATTRQ